jgi:hypothetical protein
MEHFEAGRFEYGLMAALVLDGLALGAGRASAMPNGLASVLTAAPSSVENVGWVCGPIAAGGRPHGDRDLTASMAHARALGGGAGAGTTGIGGDCKPRVGRQMPSARFICSVSAVALVPVVRPPAKPDRHVSERHLTSGYSATALTGVRAAINTRSKVRRMS